MRTYGLQNGKFVQVDNTSNIWVTTLIQTLKLSLGESPFYANYGLPAQQSVLTQIAPDIFVAMVQKQFAQYFAKLQITPVQPADNPTYTVSIVTLDGQNITGTIAT